MNLYRTGNAGGTIDNYTTLVRPELDQRRTNQQFGSDINSLENSSRVQGFNLNQLNRDTQNLQGVKYQQFFMNYGDFYPGRPIILLRLASSNRVGGSAAAPVLPRHRTYSSYPAVSVKFVT